MPCDVPSIRLETARFGTNVTFYDVVSDLNVVLCIIYKDIQYLFNRNLISQTH
jgi:hypothetical protein